MPTGSNLQTFIFCSRVSSFNVRVFLVSVTDYYIKRETDGRDKYRKNVRKPEGKGPFGRPKKRWQGIIKMDFKEIKLKFVYRFTWLRTGNHRPLWRREKTARLHKLWTSEVVDRLLTSQGGLCSMKCYLINNISWKTWRHYLRDLGVDGRKNVKMNHKKIWRSGVDSINLLRVRSLE